MNQNNLLSQSEVQCSHNYCTKHLSTQKRKQQKLVSKQTISSFLFSKEQTKQQEQEVIYYQDENAGVTTFDQNQGNAIESQIIKEEKQIDFQFPETESSQQSNEVKQKNPGNEVLQHFHYDQESIYYIKNPNCSCSDLTEERIKKLIIKQKKINKLKNKKEQKKQSPETKNLPSFFQRIFFKVVREAIDQLSETERKLFIKFETSESSSSATISKLKEFISFPTFNKLIIDYIESYQYLDNILTSEKIQDISIPIKYVNQMYKACLKPEKFTSWT